MSVKEHLEQSFWQAGLRVFEPAAALSRKPLRLIIRVLDRVLRNLHKVERNLPQLRRLAGERSSPTLDVAKRYYRALGQQVAQLPYRPLISVLVPIYKVDPRYLRETILSLIAQVYDRWELCLVDDCSQQPKITAVLEEFSARFPERIKFRANATNSHISVTSNVALAMARGEYIALLDHDDRLYPNALAEVVRYLNLFHKPDVVYSDECLVDASGERTAPVFFKPDWSPFLHLSMNYTTHLSVYRKALVDEIGGFRKGFEGSQDHDLMLRVTEASPKEVVHLPMCLYQWRAHPESTAKSQDAKPYAAAAGERAVREHLTRRGRPATVEFQKATLVLKVTYELPTPLPLVSIVIPSKDAFDLIEPCLRSLTETSTYHHFEIVVCDNGSQDPRVLALYERYGQMLGSKFKLLLKPAPFNFARQVNEGVNAASGSYVLLLNNDTELLEADSVAAMLRLAQWPEVGAVGAKLLFRNGLMQHAGIVLSPTRLAEHTGFLKADGDHFYWNLSNSVHECQAVTGACLMLSKDKYLQAGGLDELYLPNAFGDLELCLKLRSLGLSNLVTPEAKFYHYESMTRAKQTEYFERHHMLRRHGQQLTWDPYLNPNLQRDARYQTDPYYMSLDLSRRDFAELLAAAEQARPPGRDQP